MSSSPQPINFLRGWPSYSLLPCREITVAAANVMADPATAHAALEYGPDGGFEPLRHELAVWLRKYYHSRGNILDAVQSAKQHENQQQRQNCQDARNRRKSEEQELNVNKEDEDRSGEERICISGGASQSLACILQCFSDPIVTRRIWLVAPTYFLVCPIFEDAGFHGRLRAVPEDDEGVDVGWLSRAIAEVDDVYSQSKSPVTHAITAPPSAPLSASAGSAGPPTQYKPHDPLRHIYHHIIYCVPTSSNPSGKSMSLRRRQELVRLARATNALVVCDDVYDMLQWPIFPRGNSSDSGGRDLSSQLMPRPPPLPRLVDIDIAIGPPGSASNAIASSTGGDEKAHVLAQMSADRENGNGQNSGRWFSAAVSNGSFSKLLGPGVRTGWVEATPDFALGLSQTGSTRSGGAPSQLAAAIVCDMLTRGVVDHVIDDVMRPVLARRFRVVVDALRVVKERVEDVRRSKRDSGDPDASVEWRLGVERFWSNDGGVGGSHEWQQLETYGGYFVWIRLPPGISAATVARRAKEELSLTLAPGNMFQVAGDEEASNFDGFLRLCFAWEDEDGIRIGIERLGKLLLDMV